MIYKYEFSGEINLENCFMQAMDEKCIDGLLVGWLTN